MPSAPPHPFPCLPVTQPCPPLTGPFKGPPARPQASPGTRTPRAPSGLHTRVGRETEEMDRQRERECLGRNPPRDASSSAPASPNALGADLKEPWAEAGQGRKRRVSEWGAPGKAARRLNRELDPPKGRPRPGEHSGLQSSEFTPDPTLTACRWAEVAGVE